MTTLAAISRLWCGTCRSETLHGSQRCSLCGSMHKPLPPSKIETLNVHRLFIPPVKKRSRKGRG